MAYSFHAMGMVGNGLRIRNPNFLKKLVGKSGRVHFAVIDRRTGRVVSS